MTKPSFTIKKHDEQKQQSSSLKFIKKVVYYPISKIIKLYQNIKYTIQQIHINTNTSTTFTSFIPFITSIIIVYFMICIYIIFFRGYNHNFDKDGNIITYNDIVSFMQLCHHHHDNIEDEDDHDKATNILHQYQQLHPPADNPNLIRLSKLAASGFWTTTIKTSSLLSSSSSSVNYHNNYGPMLHIIGLICIIPNLYLLFLYYWKSNTSNTTLRNILLLLPLNVFPLFVCNGIATLKTLSFLCIVCSMYQYFDMKYVYWKNKMKI